MPTKTSAEERTAQGVSSAIAPPNGAEIESSSATRCVGSSLGVLRNCSSGAVEVDGMRSRYRVDTGSRVLALMATTT